jgi:DNA replication initiation complex subunit (GINS family)
MPDHYTQLLEWRRAEGTARGLAKLPPDFFANTQLYLAEVRRSYEGELRENPSGRKGELSRQTYQRASQVARDIVEGRVTKILSVAFQASVGGSRDLPNALAEERRLFDQLLDLLQSHRRSVAPFLEANAPSSPAARPGASPSPTAEMRPPPPAVDAPPKLNARLPTYVRILADGRPIATGAETIDLRKEDVVTLPPEIAKLLVDGHLAEPITPARPSPTT